MLEGKHESSDCYAFRFAPAILKSENVLLAKGIFAVALLELGKSLGNFSMHKVDLPHRDWYDFWTGQRQEGGREIARPVDLELFLCFSAPEPFCRSGQ